ncbi:DUF3150 domain-containing protein [Geomonas nitrogeniifigens]|uniref:DUF3150 domain-containing protein n=1 Tax=Geomonas diazotrophica TaxID=2843197 RepID=UPI001C2C2AB7|nr:DUF3150 domain-containing protein [Geomonas nitrogeniifigens]QXE87370.1 DUF3150 domain-containing protein [Geomonas nitrogeniifigens]
MKTQAILDKMILVVLNITLWQGRKALKQGDLALNGIDIDKLPPGTLASLGSKRIISPAAVKIFVSLKREALKHCVLSGVRFGGCGYAVPREKVEALGKELKRIKVEFEDAKKQFLSVYHEEVERWVAANPPEWAHIIRASVDSPAHIEKAITFNFAALDIRPPEETDMDGLDTEIDSLYGQLCHEVRVSARHTYENYLVGKQEITHKTLRPIRLIREKLAGLLFLDPLIADTIQVIDDTLTKLPADTNIKGTDLNMVAGLVGRQLANMGRPSASSQTEVSDSDLEEIIVIPEVVIVPETGVVAPISWDF